MKIEVIDIMNASGSESVSSVVKQTELPSIQASQQVGSQSLGLETQFHSVSDIANARNFFVPKMEMTTPTLSGIEHSGVAAMKAAEGAISPMLQLIMRLPGHLGLFSSFLEVFKNLFLPHNLLTNFNFGDIASSIDLSHAASLSPLTHLGHALGNSPFNFQAFHNMPAEMFKGSGIAHLHQNPFDSLKQSMNVSSGVDLQNPQFEGTNAASDLAKHSSETINHGDSLAGPGLSAQTVTPKLAPAERIFDNKSFLSINNNSNANSLLAFNSQPSANGITSSATTSSASNLNQINANPSSSSSSATNLSSESLATQNSQSMSSNLQGLQAKALSLETVMHKGNAHIPGADLLKAVHKHSANNPFSHLASNTRQAFQVAHLPDSAHAASPNITPSTSLDHSTLSHKALSGHYTVKSGDNLWRISKTVFGSGDKWTQLYKLNGSLIGGNPGMIFPGQKLSLAGTFHSMPHTITNGTEQLAHHPAQSSTVAHNIQHANPVHAQHSIANNHSLQGDHQLKYESAKTDDRLASASVHKPTVQGLKVETVHEQTLSGSGGAEAANEAQPVSNKISLPSTIKGKGIVSFSLTPDLAQW